jgi:hypothetical protein
MQQHYGLPSDVIQLRKRAYKTPSGKNKSNYSWEVCDYTPGNNKMVLGVIWLWVERMQWEKARQTHTYRGREMLNNLTGVTIANI